TYIYPSPSASPYPIPVIEGIGFEKGGLDNPVSYLVCFTHQQYMFPDTSTTCGPIFVTSVQQLNNDLKSSISPNPNHGEFVIDINNNGQLYLFNLIGQSIATYKIVPG